MTKSIALIGYPLSHSISPIFQQVALDYYQLDVCYELWETEPAKIVTAISRLRQPSILGANVTIPHKEAIIPLVDDLDGLARDIGAVNTIVNRDGRLTGYNTDAEGFIKALRQEGKFDPQGKRAVLLGAGGAARAVSFVLVRERVRALAIINRLVDFHLAEALVTSLRRHSDLNMEIVALRWEETEFAEVLSGCDLVVNCTPIGMRHSQTEGQSPLAAGLIPGSALVYDVVYNPVETPLLREAKGAGARTVGGLSMLVYQGAASFALWTGKEAPLQRMFRAAEDALR